MGIYASIFLAYAMSGPLLFLFGNKNIFTALAILFIIAGFFASLIKIDKSRIEPKKLKVNEFSLSFKEEVSIMIKLISKTKALSHALFSLTLAQIIILVLAVVGPGYAEHILKIKVENFPILFVTPAIIGVALGALIIGSFLHNVSKSSLTKFGMFLVGVSILLLPYGSQFESREFVQFINLYLPQIFIINVLHIMFVLAFTLGFATAFIFIPANTILQEETNDESRGKMYGVLNTLIGITSIIPVVLVGGFADIVGVKAVITGVGISVIILALIRTFITDRE